MLQKLKKPAFICTILLFMLMIWTSCGSTGSQPGSADTTADAGLSLQGTVQASLSDAAMYGNVLTESGLYYLTVTPDTGNGTIERSVCRRTEDGQEEALSVFVYPQQDLFCYLVDGKGALYYLYGERSAEGDINSYSIYLRKNDRAGNQEYCTLITQEELTEDSESETMYPEEVLKWAGVLEGTVDEDGAVCFYSSYQLLLLFDSQGEFLNESDVSRPDGNGYGGVVNAGRQGCFYYHVGGELATLQRIDMETGNLGPEEELEVSPSEVVSFFHGYNNGILFSTNEALFLHTPSGETEQLLNWGESAVGLIGSNVLQVYVDADGYQVLTRNNSGDQLKQVRIGWAEASGKQIVTLGILDIPYAMDPLKEAAAAFNEHSSQYQIECVEYTIANRSDFNEIYKDIIRGEGPDLYELRSTFLPTDVLADKGILEDLTPYFAQGDVVSQEDILPRVIEAGTYQGKLVSVTPYFGIGTLAVESGYTDNYGWTPEEFLAYGQSHPEAALFRNGTNYSILMDSYLLAGDMESYIDWEARECHFDTHSFIRLLEAVKEANISAADITEEDYKEGLLKGDYLVSEYTVWNPVNYTEAADFLKGYGELAGYPSSTGEPYFLMEAMYNLGINGSSDCKEGAWAFLEFLLSESFQTEIAEKRADYSSFPVLSSAFEEQLANAAAEALPMINKRQHFFTGEILIDISYPEITEEDCEFLRFMVSNMYRDDRAQFGSEYKDIITEEVQGFFSGDRSAEEVAANIQNRVSLYLSE